MHRWRLLFAAADNNKKNQLEDSLRDVGKGHLKSLIFSLRVEYKLETKSFYSQSQTQFNFSPVRAIKRQRRLSNHPEPVKKT